MLFDLSTSDCFMSPFTTQMRAESEPPSWADQGQKSPGWNGQASQPQFPPTRPRCLVLLIGLSRECHLEDPHFRGNLMQKWLCMGHQQFRIHTATEPLSSYLRGLPFLTKTFLFTWRSFLEFHFPVIGIVLGVIWEEASSHWPTDTWVKPLKVPLPPGTSLAVQWL